MFSLGNDKGTSGNPSQLPPVYPRNLSGQKSGIFRAVARLENKTRQVSSAEGARR